MTSTIKSASRVLGWMLLVSGLLLGYHGCARSGGGLATWAIGEPADGTVTGIRTYAGGSAAARTRFREASLISFTTASGQVITFEHPVQSSPPPFAMGERVRVYYDPDAPEDAVAPAGLAMLVFGWGFVAMAGLALVIAGAIVLLVGALPWTERGGTRA
jgi:hypothetical protein